MLCGSTHIYTVDQLAFTFALGMFTVADGKPARVLVPDSSKAERDYLTEVMPLSLAQPIASDMLAMLAHPGSPYERIWLMAQVRAWMVEMKQHMRDVGAYDASRVGGLIAQRTSEVNRQQIEAFLNSRLRAQRPPRYRLGEGRDIVRQGMKDDDVVPAQGTACAASVESRKRGRMD